MLIVFYILIAILAVPRNSGHAEETFEKTKSYCSTLLVEAQAGPHFNGSDDPHFEVDCQSAGKSPQQRFASTGHHQSTFESSNVEDGDKLWPMEMSGLQKDVQSNITFLPQLRSGVDGLRRQILCTGDRLSELGMGEPEESASASWSSGFKSQIELGEKTIQSKRKEGQRKRERGENGGSTQRRSWEFKTTVCPPDCAFTMGGGWRRTVRLRKWKCWRCRQSPLRGPACLEEDVPGPIADAHGATHCNGKNRGSEQQADDTGFARCHIPVGESEEILGRSEGGSGRSSQSMVRLPGGMRHGLERTTKELCGSRANLKSSRGEVKARDHSDHQSNPTDHGHKCVGQWTGSCCTGCTPNRATGWVGGQDRGKEVKGSSTGCLAVLSSLRQRRAGHDPSRFRQRGAPYQASKIRGTCWRTRLWAACYWWTTQIDMSYGSAEKCLRNSLRLPKQVSFIEKVEAYHPVSSDGAACRLFEIATLQCYAPSQPWIHSVCQEADFVSPYAASLSAMKFRFETIYHDAYDGFDGVYMQHAEIPSLQSRRSDQEDEEDRTGLITFDDPTILPNPAEADEPMLIIDEWEELRLLLADLPGEQSPQLHLVMYGLFQASVGNRQAVSRPDIESIRSNVVQAWQDFFLPGTTAFLHLVRPQEHLVRNEIHFIVEFSNQVVVIPSVDVPILKRIVWHEFEESEPTNVATYGTPGGNAFQTLLQLGLADWCYPWTRTVCNVHIEKRILPTLNHARLQQGSLVEIFVHPDTIESDTFSTIQSDLWLSTPHPHVSDRCCGEVVSDRHKDTCRDPLRVQQKDSNVEDHPLVGQWHRHGDLPEDYLELIAESDRHNGPQNLPRGPTTFEGEDLWIRVATLINGRGDSPTGITLHGLYGEGVGSHRAMVTTLSQTILERTIAERWPLLEHLVKRAFVVTPQPDDTAAHELTFLIEFIDPFDMPHESVRPVLEEIVTVDDERHIGKQRNPLYLTAGSSFEDIVQGIQGCDPFRHGHRCDVWLGGVPVRLRDRPLILSGHLLAVRVLPLGSSPSDDVVSKFPGAHLFEQFAIAVSARLPMSQLTWTIHKTERPGEVHQTVVLHPEWTTAHSAQFLLQLIGQSNELRIAGEGFHCAIVKNQPLDYENLHFVCGRCDPGHCLVLASFTQKWNELWQEHHSYQLPNRAGLLDIAGILQLDAFNAWTLFLNGRPFDTVGTVALQSGDVLDIEVEESSDEEDEMSALQRVRPSTSLSLKNAHRNHFDTACPVDVGERQKLVQQWKPNPQIRTPFDEIIPDMQHTPAGPVSRGRIIPPLLWEENLEFRIALAAGACSRGVDGHLRVRIRSWIVRHGSPPEARCRDFTMRPQLFIHLRDTLRRIWRDRIVEHEAMTYHVVRPNPPVEPDGTRLLHVIVELNRPLECTTQPMLLALRHIAREGVANPIWVRWTFSVEVHDTGYPQDVQPPMRNAPLAYSTWRKYQEMDDTLHGETDHCRPFCSWMVGPSLATYTCYTL